MVWPFSKPAKQPAKSIWQELAETHAESDRISADLEAQRRAVKAAAVKSKRGKER